MDKEKPPAGAADRREPLFVRATGAIAVAGGLLALSAALVVVTSVLGRWLFRSPIDGDFEIVKMATAVAIFSFLPFAQARRANIVVDTFTGGLSLEMRNRIDAFWDLAYAAFMGFLAYALTLGTLDALRSGETTMQRQLPIWPSIGLSMLLCALLALTAVLTARALLRGRGAGMPQ
jgi:TRAP-type C4-dicarboxylate transport system permease small subunit